MSISESTGHDPTSGDGPPNDGSRGQRVRPFDDGRGPFTDACGSGRVGVGVTEAALSTPFAAGRVAGLRDTTFDRDDTA
jgi:hypothetical protein